MYPIRITECDIDLGGVETLKGEFEGLADDPQDWSWSL
jgi:hypothetical protein